MSMPRNPDTTPGPIVPGDRIVAAGRTVSSACMRRWHAIKIAIPISGLLSYAGIASAHSGTGLPGGFLQGFLHPFSGFDHLLAMVAVGLWGAILGRPLLSALPVLFPMMMVGGAALAMFGVPIPSSEIGIAFSVLTLGVCIALSFKAPVWLAVPIVAVFAAFHGDAHGRELPSAADPVGYSLGFVCATGLLHVAGIGIGMFDNRRGGRVALRSIGAAIAVAGLWFLRKALRS